MLRPTSCLVCSLYPWQPALGNPTAFSDMSVALGFLGIFLLVHFDVSHGEFYKKACSNSSKMCPSVCSFCTPSEYPMECYSRFLLQACLMNFASALSAFNDTCTWNNIRDPYNTFTLCSEEGADCLFIPWPNQHVETVFVWIHRNYFNSCPTVALSDPPSSIIFALVMTPICLIPVMVVLVVMKTKNGDGSS